MRQALGIAVFFGMIGVTLFGLLFTPSFYVISRNLGTWASEKLPEELRRLRLPRLRRAR
jgi:HAE1 family hydrophobic/amphiphilic exporter-1